MGTSAEDAQLAERIFVHQLNLTSADILRKQKEREMVAEEKRKVEEMKEFKKRQKEEEKKRDMEMLQSYDPWGKPGAGVKPEDEEDNKRKKLPEPEGVGGTMDDFMHKFGRPGHGAPHRTESGRIRTQIPGDPAIRFQDNQLVRLSIENHLRYKNANKENYRGNLDELIQQKQELQQKEKEYETQKIEEMRELYPFGRQLKNDPMFMPTKPKKLIYKEDDFNPWGKGCGNPDRDQQGNVQRHKIAPPTDDDVTDVDSFMTLGPLGMRHHRGGNGDPHFTESGHQRTRLRNTMNNFRTMGSHVDDSKDTYHPWGRPGAGAPFIREDVKPFEEKMGWSMSGHPKKRSKDAKREYRNALQQEMEEKRQKQQEERLLFQEPSVELASIIRRGEGGRPRKDPITGELLPNRRQLTDVTQERLDIRRAKSQESLNYFSELAEQAAQRQQMRMHQKQMERAQSEKHVSTWDSFWGRPGHGAPRNPENHKKENLFNLLQAEQAQPYVKHYITEVVPSKHKNRYDCAMKDFTPIKKDYEFRTPFAATEA